MYTQVRVVKVLPINRIGYLEAYRCLRERNHFGILESVRLALWLSHGNEAFPPGEFAAWARRQAEEHTYSIGILMGVGIFALSVWIVWMLAKQFLGF